MKRIVWAICTAVFCAILLAGAPWAEADEHDSRFEAANIVGAWQVEVTVRVPQADCTTAMPVPFGPNPFPSLNTFHKGGTVSETGSRSPPSRRSPGHGVWQRTGRYTYDARYTFQGFDPNGFLATNMDIRSEITLAPDANTFTGVSRLNFSDISGNTLPFCATLSGVRFAL